MLLRCQGPQGHAGSGKTAIVILKLAQNAICGL
jgi:hypothetical protein